MGAFHLKECPRSAIKPEYLELVRIEEQWQQAGIAYANPADSLAWWADAVGTMRKLRREVEAAMVEETVRERKRNT